MSEWEPVIIGLKWEIRVRDFGPDTWLHLKCPCGHEADVNPAHMQAHHPGYLRIKEIEHKFHCRACGGVNDVFWSVVRRRS